MIAITPTGVYAVRLFDAVPERLFSILASPLRRVYADVLLKLYETFEAHRFGIPREVLTDVLTELLEESPDIAFDAGEGPYDPGKGPYVADMPPTPATDPDQPDPDQALASARTPRERANAVVRTLVETGWIELEMHTNYQQYVTLPDYAITLLEALKAVSSPRQVEYRGFVYATYAALSVQEVERDGHLALDTAYTQTQLLIRELKSLNNNIRRYTERLLEHRRPQDILAAHFQDYQSQVVDRSYHRLKTSDNVSKYRPRILQRVKDWLNDPSWVTAVARAMVRDQQASTVEEALDTTQTRLRFIESVYVNMDEMLEEIDRRHAQYARASLEQVRYMLNSSEDTERQLKRILLAMAQQVTDGGLDRNAPADELEQHIPAWDGAWSGLAALFTAGMLDDASLFTPRHPRQPHQPQPLAANPTDAQTRRRTAARIRQQLNRRMTPKKVNEYVLAQLGDKRSLRASELPLDSVDDFVRLIYVDAYGNRYQTRYLVERTKARARVGKFDIPDLVIRRK